MSYPATLDRLDACGASVDIGGPENLTLLEVAAVFERVTGRTGTRTHLPVPLGMLLRPFNLCSRVRSPPAPSSPPSRRRSIPGPMLERFPVRLTRLDAWVQAKYRRLQNGRAR